MAMTMGSVVWLNHQVNGRRLVAAHYHWVDQDKRLGATGREPDLWGASTDLSDAGSRRRHCRKGQPCRSTTYRGIVPSHHKRAAKLVRQRRTQR